jgi:hypothetical protein
MANDKMNDKANYKANDKVAGKAADKGFIVDGDGVADLFRHPWN